ncbi:MAG: type 1 glutamine amidotransferase [Acidobacteriota bacterium]
MNGVTVVQHVPFEGPARLVDLLARAGHRTRLVRPFAGEPLPEAGDCEALAILGGPMGIGDPDAPRWLADEARLVEGALARGVPVLGICLGAQVIAHVLGADVVPVPEPEIGWHEVVRAPGAACTPLARDWPERAVVFQWHGDGFTTPRGALRLAASAAWPDQAFAVGDRVLALQFHVETDRAAAEALVAHGAADLARGGRFVAPAREILGPAERFADLGRVADAVLGGWLEALPAAGRDRR